jgi:hypothetical protein
VDAFVLARLEQAGLTPAPPASRATLLRRVTFDLIGLPPTPQEIEDFVSDRRPDAYECVVERLLASPHYGERWTQHWLDVVRFAESNGYELDAERPHAWRYRDYVIRAFNHDMPYDRFVTEQLAGDKLASGQASANAELLVATGFNRCGQIHLVSGNTDPEVNRLEVLTEMTDAVGSVFLGLTLGCARCHDHKFDPISQADYYRLQGFFAAAQPREVAIAVGAERAAVEQRLHAIEAQIAPLQKRITDLEAPYRERLNKEKLARLEPKYRAALAVPAAKRNAEQKRLVADAEPLLKISWDEVLATLNPADRKRRAAWRSTILTLEDKKPPPPAEAWAIKDDSSIPPTFILSRGDVKRKGSIVQPAFPRVLIKPEAAAAPTSGRLDRLALARWLTAPNHPLTARVLVNRVWQHHFGRGLVATPNDFGVRGRPPTHPELLDWLACEFASHGWSIKHLHRLMVLSNTYRQASRAPDSTLARKLDPENNLFWHMRRQRLEGEALRDSVLAVAGTLNPKLGGAPVRTPLEPEVYDLIFTEGEPDGLWPVTPDPREHTRRSIYLFVKRNLRLPMLEAFDRPDTLSSCPVRPVSTFAPQALILMNGSLFQAQSKAFAARLRREGGDTDQQIERAYRLALGRAPRSAEQQMARDFLTLQAQLLTQQRPIRGTPATAALADFCLALFNRNEFVYID